MTDDDLASMVEHAHTDERVAASRCDDGHEWPPDWSNGDTCLCGELYLIQQPNGCMKVVER